MAWICPAWPGCGCGTQSKCEYRVECERRYRECGIDVCHPDPDGSDYHLMNLIDEEVAKEYRWKGGGSGV